jgi:hypothetical protein
MRLVPEGVPSTILALPYGPHTTAAKAFERVLALGGTAEDALEASDLITDNWDPLTMGCSCQRT